MTALFKRPERNEQKASGGAASFGAHETPKQQSGNHEPVIHTMPAKFMTTTARSTGGHRGLLIAIIALLVALGGATAAYFYFSGQTDVANGNTNANTNTVANANTANVNTNANGNTNGNTNAVATTTVTATFLDPETKVERGTATLFVPDGALPTTVSSAAMTALSPALGAYATDTRHVAIGGVFLLLPSGTKLRSSIELTLTYTDRDLLDADVTDEATDLSLASWSGTAWEPFTSVVNEDQNSVTADITEFFADGVAVVFTKAAGSTNTNSSLNTNQSTTVTSSLDSDADGLTNQEETLYGTNANLADTDGDTYKDGSELIALYSPAGAGRLADTALVQSYANTTFRYSMLVPKGWTIGALDGDNIVTFTTITGEFVQVSVLDNPSRLSAREWYLTLNPSIPASALTDAAVGTLSGIIGPDHLNLFLADSAHIYQVTYNIGIREEANYLSTFTMMYMSFRVTAAATNSNSNGNTNSATNANSNTNRSS